MPTQSKKPATQGVLTGRGTWPLSGSMTDVEHDWLFRANHVWRSEKSCRPPPGVPMSECWGVPRHDSMDRLSRAGGSPDRFLALSAGPDRASRIVRRNKSSAAPRYDRLRCAQEQARRRPMLTRDEFAKSTSVLFKSFVSAIIIMARGAGRRCERRHRRTILDSHPVEY